MTTIDTATACDIPAIMRLERGDGFEDLVGRWSAEQHAAEMALPGSHYLLAQEPRAGRGAFSCLALMKLSSEYAITFYKVDPASLNGFGQVVEHMFLANQITSRNLQQSNR